MSARARVTTAAAIALTAAITGGTALLPTAAHAATPASPLTMTVTGPSSNAGSLVPGGSPETLTVTVTNPTATAQQFAPEVSGSAHGALSIDAPDVAFAVSARNAPATDSSIGGQDEGLIGAFYPKGGHFGDHFTVPAHTSYSWLITLGATKSWPLNDDSLKFDVNGDAGRLNSALTFKVGTGHTGGPVVETLSGGTTLAPGQPLVETLSVTNRTGAAIASPWNSYLDGAITPGVDLGYEVWTAGHWVPLTHGGAPLPAIPAGLADGATATYKLRITATGYHAAQSSVKTTLSFESGIGYPIDGASRTLTVYRTAQPGTPGGGTTTPAPTHGATTPSTSASASPSGAASAPASQVPAGASLAHTGGGSDTGVLLGGALAFVGAGLALMAGLKRRARRS
ncbi:hypothetical protein [Streptacidiphilus sp. EB129]|uniref:hypothetical protein n=1 Tax=Streptacidiphilus sp. EB129 TaxID=3156262 RepID=UPI0035182A12